MYNTCELCHDGCGCMEERCETCTFILEETSRYRQHLQCVCAGPAKRLDEEHRSAPAQVLTSKEKFDHLLWMLDQMEEHLRRDQKQKAMRWLGFIQGVLWSEGAFTINELRDHNRRG